MRGVDLVGVHGAILDIFHWTKRDQRKHRRVVCVSGGRGVVRKGLQENGDF